MVDGAGGLDELFRPGYGFVVFDPQAEPRRVRRDGGGDIEVALSAAQRNAARRLPSSVVNQFVGFALTGAVPQGQDVGFALGEVAGMRGPASVAAR